MPLSTKQPMSTPQTVHIFSTKYMYFYTIIYDLTSTTYAKVAKNEFTMTTPEITPVLHTPTESRVNKAKRSLPPRTLSKRMEKMQTARKVYQCRQPSVLSKIKQQHNCINTHTRYARLELPKQN